MVCVRCTLKATTSLSFRSEIVKEKKNKRVSAKSIAARQARYLSKTRATFVPARLFCLLFSFFFFSFWDGGTVLTSLQSDPVLVFVCLSLNSWYSTPLAVFCSFTSPQHISRCSWHPRSSKWRVLFSQSVFKSASGLHIPSKPFSYNIFNSSLVKATDGLGLFPLPCFFSCFCLDWRTFLVFSNTKSLIMLTE